MATEVGGYDVITEVCERTHLIGEVLLHTSETVHQHERPTADPVLENGHLDVTQFDGSFLHVTHGTSECDIHPSPTAHPRRRFPWALALRIAGSLLLLGLLVWKLPNFRAVELVPTWTAATGWWLLASAATLLVAFGLQTLRWSRVLVPLGYHAPFRRLFNQFLAGQFVSNVLPTAFGGDVVRVARLGRDIDDWPIAFASVALERLTGWLVLPAISLVTIAFVPEFRGLGAASITMIVIDIMTLVALLALLAVAANRRWAETARTARGWRRWIGSVHLGIEAIRSTPGAALSLVGAGLAFQLAQCMSVWMVARALDLPEVTLAAVLAFFPPTAISQNLPVGFGGLGVREGGFILFFGALGVSHERALAFGLTTYLITVVVSAIGAPSFALGGGRRELRLDAAHVQAADL